MPTKPALRYLLPCTHLGAGGLWEYVLVDLAQARDWIRCGRVQHFLTHPLHLEVCEHLLETFLGLPRKGPLPTLGFHDDALVCAVEGLDAARLLTLTPAGQLAAVLAEERYSFGCLKRLG